MTAAAKTPPTTVVADPQDPLPESNWKPRRWFAFLNLAVGLIMALVSLVHAGGEGIGWIAVYMITNGILYLVAPSGEQAVKMLAAVSAMKAGIAFRSSSSVTTPDGAQASTTSTAGQAGKVADE